MGQRVFGAAWRNGSVSDFGSGDPSSIPTEPHAAFPSVHPAVMGTWSSYVSVIALLCLMLFM